MSLELSGSLIGLLAEVPPPGDPTGVTGEEPASQAASPRRVEAEPNPFQDRTRLRFTVAEEGTVRVEVFDANGRLVRRLYAEARGAGSVELDWDGRDGRGRKVSAGLYFARVADAKQERTARVVVRR